MEEISSASSYRAGKRDSVVELIRRTAAKYPDRPFVVVDGAPYSYSEIDRRSNAMARELAQLGVAKGHCVVTLFDTNIDVFTCWFAINKLGAVWVPINTAYRGEFLRHQVADTEARIVICDDHYLDRFVQIAAELPDLELILTRNGATDQACLVPIKRLDDFRGSDASALPPVVTPKDLAALIYTSGTTGPSKGCMISHNYLTAVARINRRYTWLKEGQTLWTCLPVFHVAALGGVLSVMEDGSCAALARQFSLTRFWEDIEASGATSAMLMASIFALVAHAPETEAEKRCRGQLKMVFGVPITPAVRKIWQERFGVELVYSWSYGQTEAVIRRVLEEARGDCRRLAKSLDAHRRSRQDYRWLLIFL
jgi:crotonobetaine/carnitine-CoA ligase